MLKKNRKSGSALDADDAKHLAAIVPGAIEPVEAARNQLDPILAILGA
jgi:hypothetical protein